MIRTLVNGIPETVTCLRCKNFQLDGGTPRCRLFDQPIDDEYAEDCLGFEPFEDK